ncbi:protein MAIN-LIKE 1-like [Papaver somniferum]|uniref:protein MAIN-LIKE 1-like n=1 Tax=Papaver somniferum TaxID=3469 RepID=UPI000E70364C|nr:protein MAIN-LIKE 1-like [Papaver somniferum]
MGSYSVRRGDRPPSKEVADEIDEDTVEESDRDEHDETKYSHETKGDEVDDENNDKDDAEITSYEHDNENDDNDDEEHNNKDSNIEYKEKMVVEASDSPGQPIDPHLLCYYGDHIGDHIARVVWENSNPRKNPRSLLNIHQHQDMVKIMWPIDKEYAKVQEYVQNSGFYPLIKYGHHKIDRALINVFRERWYPETNTYHLPFGEMTPTIEDVERITGLPSKGEEVYTVYSGKTMTSQFMFDLIKRTLGKTEAEIKKEGALCGTPKQQENKSKLN